MELSSKLVSAIFPQFHLVASIMVYTLQPTMFYQSGVHCNNLPKIPPEIVCDTNNL